MDLYPNSFLDSFSALSSGPSKTSNSLSITFLTAIRSDLMNVMTLTPSRSSIVSKGFSLYFSFLEIFSKKLLNFFIRI